MEIMFINPDVILFHDVLSDIEIEKLKETARPKSAHSNCTKHDRNRIATVMFYMSEAALGGATVFTHLGLTVYPIKGAAVFWYNTHPSGERNPAMIHAACPVLLGSKWGKQYLGLDPVYDQVDLGNADIYTSMVGLETLPRTLKNAIDDLGDYINVQERKLFILLRYIDRFKTEHDKAMENTQNYVENPIKAFTLIKQLTSDLDNLKIIIETGTDKKSKSQDDFIYPLQEDLIGAAAAIARLQKTYELNLKDLSKGNLSNVVYRPPMTAGDCYVLGQILLNEQAIKQAISWLIESLRKYYTEGNVYSFNEINIIQYISKAYHILGDKKSALQWAQKLVELHPQHLKAKKMMTYYDRSIANDGSRKKLANGIKNRDNKQYKLANIGKGMRTYEALCRGELVVPIKTSSRYTCRYLTEQAFLKISPIKMEVMYLNPDVILFYDVLNDNEMESIKQISKPRLNRYKAHDPETGNTHFVEESISKYTWILDTESDVIARISRRVMHLTNLNMARAEPLQVVNYGIGGQFEPHCDFPPVWSPVHQDARYAKTGGDRIATVMFYMSDVALGGATVFPEIGLSVAPVKGAALYWPNLNGAGELDATTLHAGCPVLLGSKWVCNKWIHHYGQDDFKPCKLGYQNETRKIPSPVSNASRDRNLFAEYKHTGARQTKNRHPIKLKEISKN